MNNRIIKLKTFQEKAVFRVPYSMEVIETYPLPPYSTILGLVHNVLSSSTTINDINISVQGKYGNLVREFISYHKYEKDKKEGKRYPIIVTSLIDLELIIHIKMSNEKLHSKLLCSLSNPPYFLYLGRPEDLIIEMKVCESEEIELDPSKTEKGGITLPYNSYIPFEIAQYLELEGIPYLIPSYYQLLSKPTKKRKPQEIFRNFEMIKVKYAHAEQTVAKKLKIHIDGIPIWWMK
ncbi:CRISPR-associated protein Cas5t [Candidatus Kryptobacter tengchongensis]|nr:CRISPR-associated protein Cas5t [Candidatus Kryptobacter tengchongensis]